MPTHGLLEMVRALPPCVLIAGVGLVLCMALCLAAVAVLYRRLSHQKRLQERLGEALANCNAELQEAYALSTRVLKAACHDLRQPTHALGLLANLAADSAESASCRLALEGITRCTAALSEMLGMLLDITRLREGQYVPVLEDLSLDELMDEVGSYFAALPAMKCRALVSRRTGIVVRSDRQLLRRIVFNLVANAVRHVTCGDVELDAWEEGPEVVLLVADSGPGIPPDRLADVFRDHPRLGPSGGGLGIGLGIVRRAAGLLEHEFKLDSRPGEGTQATLRLPLVLHPAGVTAAPRPPCRGGGRLLALIEDDPEAAHAAADYLRRWGFRILAAASAQALARALGEVRPALVVSDFQLGNAPDGLEQVRLLRRLWPGLPALLLTGDLSNEMAARAAIQGVRVAYKPLAPQRLLARIHETLDASPSRTASEETVGEA